MAHFAELGSNNTVLRVIVVGNADCIDISGNESEAVGISFCKSLFGQDSKWVQTSYNGRIRRKYAGLGDTYDEVLDMFIPPKPYPSWTLNQNTGEWEPPVPMPSDGQPYEWNEEQLCWTRWQHRR